METSRDELAWASTAARMAPAASRPCTVLRWIWPSDSSELRASCTPSAASASPRSMRAAVASTSSRTAWMMSPIDLVERAIWAARSRIWSATTAKALPCSPAWAAMMEALSESRLVRPATSEMKSTTWSMSSLRRPRMVMRRWASETAARRVSMPCTVSSTTPPERSAMSATARALASLSPAARSSDATEARTAARVPLAWLASPSSSPSVALRLAAGARQAVHVGQRRVHGPVELGPLAADLLERGGHLADRRGGARTYSESEPTPRDTSATEPSMASTAACTAITPRCWSRAPRRTRSPMASASRDPWDTPPLATWTSRTSALRPPAMRRKSAASCPSSSREMEGGLTVRSPAAMRSAAWPSERMGMVTARAASQASTAEAR